ncbi:YbbR-like domain-containing protein [Aggregatimonas sangjinii]|uniref:YbbR-like domain-containing protein n=1 Tax=Aggregatimonas sangjinii TaxID=2583587 RepID=A0A5B7SNR8_9FLAO|nr:CdaR family protein [Aggregatimonas sangjinii]QCX00255.1 YbbR-like domain-containing protein [Aggregatimonas sangjinii]
MIEKIKNILKKRKAKLFFVFLFLSGLAWFISNLSNRYQGISTFELEFVNPPDSMMLVNASRSTMDVRLDAVGFQFLMFNLSSKKVEINLSDAIKKGGKYYLTPDSGRRQMEKQMTNGVKILDFGIDTLFFEFYDVISKKVPIKSKAKISFAQNYLLDGAIKITPDSIVLKGPQNEVDSIQFVETNAIELSELNDDFSIIAKLTKAPMLVKTEFSEEHAVLSGKVSRFSEKVVRVPVSIINLPENTVIQTFPNEVNVLVKASVDDLKKVRASDLEVIGDYKSVEGSDQNSIELRISRQPAAIHSVGLSKNQVDFILKRE